MHNPNATYKDLIAWNNQLRRQRATDLNPPFWLLPLIINKAKHDQTTEDHLRTMGLMEATGLAWYWLDPDSHNPESEMRLT